ncbi:hypothetical protein A6E15_00285 [Natrinema saccharevitans]|uniref:Glycosyltransferase 2-like domain-containing protein n=1 Tax=Natrinema saccharevitans TaxID=301967 RepID=A0A1S8ASN4_9EURY|nr:glycosyltransferase family 2 protein [Natrinema saccharevitans]OLZ39514.1 hypothetical protein A6E15_00285 [Natrinema saccharevitans]
MSQPERDQPLVSIVIPTYERPDLLGDAVESVSKQTYDPIELVIVDDGSTTHPETALDGASHSRIGSVRVCCHDTNLGANVARKTGISASSGEYVAFLDDDDYWQPRKIERQVRALERTAADVGVAFTGQHWIDDTGTVTDVVRPETEGDFMTNLARGARFGPFSTVMVRSEVFERAGYPDDRFPCWQDREWYFRIAEHYDFVSIPEPLTVRRFIGSERISNRYEAKRDTAYPLLVEKHGDRVATLGRRADRLFRGELSRGIGHDALLAGRYVESIRHLLRSLRYRPLAVRTYAHLFAAVGGPYTHRFARTAKRTINRLRYRSSGNESDTDGATGERRPIENRPPTESHR